MKYVFLIPVLFVCFYSNGQSITKEVTFEEVISDIRKIDVDKKTTLEFKKYLFFDFRKFLPNGNYIDGADFYEIGSDISGVVREIRFRSQYDSCRYYDLVVYEYKKYRILAVKAFLGNETVFNPVVILILKNTPGILLINLIEQFGENSSHTTQIMPSIATKFYSVSSIKKLSAIMQLDDSLLPISLLKFYDQQLVSKSEFIYENKIFQNESVYYFFNTKVNPAPSIDSKTDLLKFLDDRTMPDDVVDIYPSMTCGIRSLWLQNGAHGYVECAHRVKE